MTVTLVQAGGTICGDSSGKTGCEMPRFVILTHDHPHWHWDFMLESTGVLRTWRLDQEPSEAMRSVATPLPDHRLIYLEYEGPVSGNRGQVQRWDQGEYELLSEAEGTLTVGLHGSRLKGRARIFIEDQSSWFEFIEA